MKLHTFRMFAARGLDTPINLVRVTGDDPDARLNAAERNHLLGLRHAERREDWLLGRRALKSLLVELGRDDDTSVLSFPEPQLSLTHGGTVAIAAGTRAAVAGIGIDFEPIRKIDTRVGRWFLTGAEATWLHRQAYVERSEHLLRLWTVKEAIFKSFPRNADLSLDEIILADPAASITRASVRGSVIRWVSRRFDTGYLAIAVNKETS